MGISPLAVVIAAGVWTWLWGPIGLLLSTPLTMCVVVMGRHVKGLRFLEVLLGDQPALSDEESFYLRLLSGNADDVADQAEHWIKARGLVTFLDDVARRGLGLAQSDFDRAELEPTKCETIRSTVTNLVETLSLRPSRNSVLNNEATTDGEAISIPSSDTKPVVMCVAGRGVFDEPASLLFESLLRDRDIATAREARTPSSAPSKEHEKIRVVCLCVVDAAQVKGIRFRVRRAGARYPSAIVIAGLWGGFNQADTQCTATNVECDGLARTFKDAAKQIESTLDQPTEELLAKGATCPPESSLADH
jgi:hypothetical protein